MSAKFDDLLSRFDRVQRRGKNYMARCSAHDDKSPSLALSELDDGRILIKCFAGCDAESIVSAVGLTLSDLFPNDEARQQYRSFQSLAKVTAKKPDSGIEHEKTILDIAKNQRANGQRLNKIDLERERLAFMRVRKHAESD